MDLSSTHVPTVHTGRPSLAYAAESMGRVVDAVTLIAPEKHCHIPALPPTTHRVPPNWDNAKDITR